VFYPCASFPCMQLGAFVGTPQPSEAHLRSILASVMLKADMARHVQAVGARVRAEPGNDNAVSVLTSCLCSQVLPSATYKGPRAHSPRRVIPPWWSTPATSASFVCTQHCVLCNARPAGPATGTY
jgi:hypothetical protein